MIEVLVAMFITLVAAASIASMLPISWNTASKADLTGRANALLQNELEWRQYQAMRGVNPTTLEYPVDGQYFTMGNVKFTVKTITSPDLVHPNTWLINVRVIWPGNSVGVVSSIRVTRQLGFNNKDNS